MKMSGRAAIMMVVLLTAALHGGAQTAAQTPAGRGAAQVPASITGRVTDGERGLLGVTLSLIVAERGGPMGVVASARTDSEGHYRFESISPGRYQVYPYAPAHFTDQRGGNMLQGAKIINVLAGESVEDVDFRLTKGGVITGRVTDSDGQPVIGEQISIVLAERRDGPPEVPLSMFQRVLTDDRGIYRAYGLTPGRYRVSAGVGGGTSRYGGAGRYYQRTFHPNVTVEENAAIIEVSAGSETERVDIRMGRSFKTFRAAGRIVNAETGQAVVGVRAAIARVEESGRGPTGYATSQPTDARGEFAIDGLVPGRYVAMLAPTQVEGYSEPTRFEVASADVRGIEVLVRQGTTVSGTVQIEGVGDRATLARLLEQVRIYGFADSGSGTGAPSPPIMARASGGTFTLSGVRPGRLRLNIDADFRILTVSRIELNGADVTRDAITVAAGSHVTGVNVVLVYGSATVRGQVAVAGGGLPPNTRVAVFARRVGGDAPFTRQTEVDARGRFQLEGLAAGAYEFQAQVFGPGPQQFRSQPQQVFVVAGSEQQISFTLEPVAQ